MTCLKTMLGLKCHGPHTEAPDVNQRGVVNRKVPFMLLDLDFYTGSHDEIFPDHTFDVTCGWCGAFLANVDVIHEPMLGDPCCSDRCADLLDDWMFEHVIDPEHEIPKIIAEAKQSEQ